MCKKNLKRMQFGYKSSYLFLLFCIFTLTTVINPINAQTTPNPLGAKLLSEIEYDKLPKVNWEFLRANANKQAIAKQTSSIVMLNNPPIGNQHPQGSCVGWAVGYAATSILAYPKFNNNWNNAKRSPNFIYNQIKIDPNDCESGTYTTTGLNLVANQGVCSYTLMPYVYNDCVTLPNNAQRFDAALNTVLSWSTLNRNNVSGMKQALDLGYPVVIAFSVYESFDNMWSAGGVWNTANTGLYRGGHAACIIGYDDTKQMFKVQNSWGTSGGDNGYFWVTYDLVQNNCLNEAYILSEVNQSVYPSISGISPICTQAIYSINNLPTGATVTWSSSNPSIATVIGSGNTATVTKVANGSIILTAIVNIGSTNTTLTKNIHIGNPSAPTRILNFSNGDILGNYSIYDFALEYDLNQGVNQFNWVVSGGTILSGQGTNTIQIRTVKRPKGAPNYIFNVDVKIGNTCGWSNVLWVTGYVSSSTIGPAAISLSPNPTSNQVEVNIVKVAAVDTTLSTLTENLNTTSYKISVINSYGNTVYSATKNETKFSIPTTTFRNGIYSVIASDGINTYQNKLIIQH